ncbi:unnamed protein product [Zymoseptoria tritici ST99CH_3D1]|nr:unnamed protein product [Zymoseptoria tritici ST99CH_3D1]
MTRSGHSEEIDLALAFGSAVSRTEESTSDFVDWQIISGKPKQSTRILRPRIAKEKEMVEVSDDEESIDDEDDMDISDDDFGMRTEERRPVTLAEEKAESLSGKNSTSMPDMEQKRAAALDNNDGSKIGPWTTVNLSDEIV